MSSFVERRCWVLGFDIERSGGTGDYDTIAIGATVINTNFAILGSYLGKSYDRTQTTFESRCYNDFWLKHMDVLRMLHDDRDIPYAQKQKEMIVGFVEFVRKWEIAAQSNGVKLYKVSDNLSFDVHFINSLIHQHYGDQMLPFPYQFSTQQYGKVFETHSMIKGLLFGVSGLVDLGSDQVGRSHVQKLSTRLQILYPDLPKCPVPADHMPHRDAQNIAHQFLWLHGISCGKYQLRGLAPVVESQKTNT